MDKSKWRYVAREELSKLNHVTLALKLEPEYWPQVKKAHLEFIKEMDSVTEVYDMENTKK